MGIREMLFGSPENAGFKADQPDVPAAETPIVPDNKQEVMPNAAISSPERGRMIADTETVEEIPGAISKLEAIINAVENHDEKLPQQN